MIYNYPYSPYFNYKKNYFNNYYNKINNYPIYNKQKKIISNENNNIDNTTNIVNNSTSNTNSTELINIMGIKLSFDDLLIIGLLYILYQQEVNDLSLYLILILLLIN